MSLNYYKCETEKCARPRGGTMNLKKERGTDVMMEMGDVFSYLFQLAHMLNVDLDKMWVEHKQKVKTKNYNM